MQFSVDTILLQIALDLRGEAKDQVRMVDDSVSPLLVMCAHLTPHTHTCTHTRTHTCTHTRTGRDVCHGLSSAVQLIQESQDHENDQSTEL